MDFMPYVLFFVMLVVVVGLVAIIWFRFREQQGKAPISVTRTLLAIILVGSLAALAAASLMLNNGGDLQKLLVGAVISLSSAVVAFYFASANATEARKDLLSATSGRTFVPDLVGKTLEEAQRFVAGTAFILADLPSGATPGSIVKTQIPAAGTPADGWQQSIKITLNPPPPPAAPPAGPAAPADPAVPPPLPPAGPPAGPAAPPIAPGDPADPADPGAE